MTLLSPCVISMGLSHVLRLEKKKALIGLLSHKANKFVKKATLICQELAPVGLHIPFSTLQATVHLECVIDANCKIFHCLMSFLKVVKYRLFSVSVTNPKGLYLTKINMILPTVNTCSQVYFSLVRKCRNTP